MSTPTRPYAPIACGLVDELQLRAMRRTPVRVTFLKEGAHGVFEGRIADIRSRDGAEFLLLEEGPTVRLDALVEVDGIPFGAGC